MAERRTLFTTENLQTIVGVSFVLALLSVAFCFYNFSQINQLAAMSGGATGRQAAAVRDVSNKADEIPALQDRIKELEGKLADLESKLVAQAAAAPAPEAPE